MIAFRWLILRTWFSVLALPVVAFAVLWLLHEVIFPGDEFQDLPIILVAFVLILPVMNALLWRNGMARYNYLQRQLQLALAANDDESAEAIFAYTRQLFASGLLSPKLVSRLQNETRRQFLPLYERNLDAPEARDALRQSMREGHRREEIYALLRNHLLVQPLLAGHHLDLAEELVEQKPEDAQLLSELVRKLLADKARHYRAEYFYGRHLAAGGEHAPAIVSLSLENVLAKKRQDDFSLWVYVRAFEAGHAENVNLRRMLFLAQQRNLKSSRHDKLARTVSEIAGSFSAEEFALMSQSETKMPTPFYAELRERFERGFLIAKKKLAEFYFTGRPLIKEIYARQRRYVLIGAGAIGLITSLVVMLANRPTPQAPLVVAEDDNAAGYFTLQVGAWKKSRSAEQEKGRLQRAGLSVRILTPHSSKVWYRIHVGKYPTRRAAQAAADSLKQVGVIEDYFIVEYEGR